MIREHPYETVGAAFGLGLLIGILAAARLPEKKIDSVVLTSLR